MKRNLNFHFGIIIVLHENPKQLNLPSSKHLLPSTISEKSKIHAWRKLHILILGTRVPNFENFFKDSKRFPLSIFKSL